MTDNNIEKRQYAGFWLRVLASLIDALLLLLIIIPLLTIIYGSSYWLGEQWFHGFWDVSLNYIFPLVATLWFWKKFMATPGKMILKLRVVDEVTGDSLTIKQSLVRYFGYILSFLPLCLGFLWVAFDKNKQGFHDKLAGSVIIRR